MYTLIISTSISELYTTMQYYIVYSVVVTSGQVTLRNMSITLYFFFFYIVIGNEIKKKLHQKVIK